MRGLISVDEALTLIARNAFVPSEESVPLDAALGTRLAAPVIARVSRPPVAVSAMDGYAVRLADVATDGTRLRVIGDAPAGRPFVGSISAGEAVRIFTGSVIPEGADHVVIQEDAKQDGDAIICRHSYAAPEHVRQAGIDFADGETLLEKGALVTPAVLSVAAAANHGSLSVYKRPRVGILANGDELREPGSALDVGQIVNSNPPGLSALIREWGGEPVDLGVAEDTLTSIRTKIDDAREVDIFLPVGGASVGDHDLMRPAFAKSGFRPVFEKVAVKPGKPTWFSARDQQRVIGLPGNPASAFVCAHLFLKPLLTGRSGHSLIKARSVNALPAPGGRETFLRAAVHVGADGVLEAEATTNQDSSLITPFLRANALIRRLAGTSPVEPGDLVDVVMIGPIRQDR
jgi:molybdopterin molybdotransferase